MKIMQCWSKSAATFHDIADKKRTGGTETSKYPEEKKSNEIP